MYCRFLNTDDLSQFRELRLEALETDPSAFATTYERERNLPDEKFKQRLKHTDAQFAVGGFEHDNLVSVASFLKHTGPKMEHKGMLLAMYCKKGYRGTGIAKNMVQFLLKEVKQLKNTEMLHLMVLSENTRAKNFYTRLGFVTYGTEPRALYDGERYYDEDLMFLDLTKEA